MICAVHIVVIKYLSSYVYAYFSRPCLHNLDMSFECTEFILLLLNVSYILHYFKFNIL
jgi:hypothetical protein